MNGMNDPYQTPPAFRESCHQVDAGIEFVLTPAQLMEGYDRLNGSSWRPILILIPVFLAIPLQGFLSPKGFDPKSYIAMACAALVLLPLFVFFRRRHRRKALDRVAKDLQDTMLMEMTEQYFRLSCDRHMHKRPWAEVTKLLRSESVILLTLNDGTSDLLPRHPLMEGALARYCPLPITGSPSHSPSSPSVPPPHTQPGA